jgi:ribonuclease R
VGERTHRVFQLGDHVRVQVARVDVERRMIDLAIDAVLDTLDREPRRTRQPRSTAVRKKEQRKGTPEERRRRRAARPGRRERAQRKKSR